MKKKISVFLVIAVTFLFCGCGVVDIFQINEEIGQEAQEEVSADKEKKDLPKEEALNGTEAMPGGEKTSGTGELTEADSGEEQELKDIAQNQEKVYIGEYLDYDNAEPNLEIAKGEDGKYVVQIGIFRLCSLEDGVGDLTAEGMTFTATDPAGNPISGVITVEEGLAKVTFTDSTWEYLENGTTYEYVKSSEIPNIWGE